MRINVPISGAGKGGVVGKGCLTLFMLPFVAAGLFGQQSMSWTTAVLAAVGLAVGLYARRKVDAD